jgi:uncharacterized protein YjiS (DUF1127 family)
MTYYAPAHLLAAPQGFVDRVRHWIEMRRTLDAIAHMDDRMLADIGWYRAPQPKLPTSVI